MKKALGLACAFGLFGTALGCGEQKSYLMNRSVLRGVSYSNLDPVFYDGCDKINYFTFRDEDRLHERVQCHFENNLLSVNIEEEKNKVITIVCVTVKIGSLGCFTDLENHLRLKERAMDILHTGRGLFHKAQADLDKKLSR